MYTRSNLLVTAGVGQFLLEILIRNLLLAALIYINLRVLLPAFVRKQKSVAYVCLLAILLSGYALLKNIHDVYLFGYVLGEIEQQQYFHNTFYNISIALFYVAFSIALELSREWYEQRELIRRIEVERLNTELDYLKAQINPHFLFNSLNTIYFQIDKQNKNAREMLSAFSDMLRYQLYECNGKEISIEKEIVYLANYVRLQRMRKDENCGISMTTGSGLTGFSIAPLLLIPFVENAFKHVSHLPNNNEIRISLTRFQDTLSMNVFNTRDQSSRSGGDTGIGLRNVKRRLELVYNGNHSLDVIDKAESFEIRLSLKINNHQPTQP
jgi:LytS/YehU family sensor histidine kinase